MEEEIDSNTREDDINETIAFSCVNDLLLLKKVLLSFSYKFEFTFW